MANPLRRKGKEPATKSSEDPLICNQDDAPIVINQYGCTLVIENGWISGTSLQRATCNTRPCVVTRKTLDAAYNMHNALSICNHPNILKSIGVWEDPEDSSRAYIALMSVDDTIHSLDKESMFCYEQGHLVYGFSELGFKMFRDIFSAINSINNLYEGEATSSTSKSIPLLPMMLEAKNIFFKRVRGEVRVMLGNFKMRLSDEYIKKSRKGRRIDPTREDLEAAHWKEVGRCLKSLYGTGPVSMELCQLADFLTGKIVKYDELLWQPGLWDANIKMQFIREIFWLVDMERDKRKTVPHASTKKGKQLSKMDPLGLFPLMRMFPKPKDDWGREQQIVENHLLHSLLFLRNTIVAHYDEQYQSFKGPKDEIGTDKTTIERYIQTIKGDYMITLVKIIRELGWITESPILRGETDYMASFYKMKIEEEERRKKKNRQKGNRPICTNALLSSANGRSGGKLQTTRGVGTTERCDSGWREPAPFMPFL